MLTNETISKLHDMHLGAMARRFKEQLDDTAVRDLSFEDRFGLLVDAEWTTRKSNHLGRIIKKAGYAIPGACVEDIEYGTSRDLRILHKISNGFAVVIARYNGGLLVFRIIVHAISSFERKCNMEVQDEREKVSGPNVTQRLYCFYAFII